MHMMPTCPLADALRDSPCSSSSTSSSTPPLWIDTGNFLMCGFIPHLSSDRLSTFSSVDKSQSHLLGDSCSEIPRFNIQTEIDKFFPGGVEDNSISLKFPILFANPLIIPLPHMSFLGMFI